MPNFGQLLLGHGLGVDADVAIRRSIGEDELDAVLVARAVTVGVNPSGLIQQRLGHGRVKRVGLERRIGERWGHIPEGDCWNCQAEQQIFGERETVEGIGDRLTYTHILHRWMSRLADEEEPALIKTRDHAVDLHPGCFQLVQIRVGEERAYIAVASDEGIDLCGIIRDEAHEDLVQYGGVPQ